MAQPPQKRPPPPQTPPASADLDAAGLSQDSIIIDVGSIHDAAQTLVDSARTARANPIVSDDDTLDPAGLNQDSIIITADALGDMRTLAAGANPIGLDETLPSDGLRSDAFPLAETAPSSAKTGRQAARSIHDIKHSIAVRIPYEKAQVIRTIGEYDVLSELGRGGMGVVYKAYARRLQRYVAIKMIRAGEHAPPIAVARFINEAMLAARLQHPNITAVYDSGETDDGASYFVMEYVEGRDLAHYLEKGLDRSQALVSTTDVQKTVADVHDGKLSLRVALLIIEKAARALEHAHQLGIIHRDIKPDNILIDARLEPHLTDFGIAKALEADNLGLTTDGDVMGTPYYMSPEQAGGESKSIGPHSDVYSLGAMLFHVLTGRPVYEGPTAMAIILQVMGHNEPPKPSAVLARAGQPAIPQDLETICLKAIEKPVERRYPTALAFADDLRRFLEGQQISARPLSSGERFQRTLQRNRPLLVAATLTMALLISLAAAFGISLIRNIESTSKSLQEQDTQQALTQASTLERAIAVNMLQGRADLARELVNRLAEDSTVSSIAVARLDKTPAYSSASTRKQVESYLSRPDVEKQIAEKFPELTDEISELKRRAFPNIDQAAKDTFDTVAVNPDAWAKATKGAGQEVTYIDTLPSGKRELIVLKPIPNGPKCQACHGDTSADSYGANQLRAVVVLHRPLDKLDAMIAENRRSTWTIGAISAAVILSVLFALARLFGVGLGKRRVWKSE